jgi:hypothetical protein
VDYLLDEIAGFAEPAGQQGGLRSGIALAGLNDPEALQLDPSRRE